jgi:molybdenum cofactor cytidylyltransferase
MISAIILAAGESKRMGQPKMLLPWGEVTVLGQVISTYQAAGVSDVLVVTGGAREQVDGIVRQHEARSVFNERYAGGEMLSSLQCGLQLLSREAAEVEAALIGLGDQPQIQEGAVRRICEAFRQQAARLIVPSFQMRRGHPWLVERSLWEELLELQPPQSPRDFLNRHAGEILYVEVDNPSILADLDTPQDYRNARPDP